MNEWFSTASLFVASASLIFTVIKTSGGGVWKISERLNKLDLDRDKSRRQIEYRIDEKHNEAINLFGESLRAQAEHLRLLELEVYKNFVRRDTFDNTIKSLTDQMNTTVKALTDQMNSRFDRMEKIVEDLR